MFLVSYSWEKLRKKRRNNVERARGPPATLLNLTLTHLFCQHHLPHQRRAKCAPRQPSPKRAAGLGRGLPAGDPGGAWGGGRCSPQGHGLGGNAGPGPAMEAELAPGPARDSRIPGRSPRPPLKF